MQLPPRQSLVRTREKVQGLSPAMSVYYEEVSRTGAGHDRA